MITQTSHDGRHKLRRRSSRPGGVLLVMVVLLIVAAAITALVWFYLSRASGEAVEDLIVRPVIRGSFEHIVLEQGTVESPAGDELREVRCKVKGRSTTGTPVLWAIDEGTHVQAGDKLVQLDSSALEQELVTQKIACNTSAAAEVQAENTLRAAEIARVEYLEGSFKQEEQAILSEIFVAEENLRRAQLAYKSTERLAAKGIVTSLQLEGDQFAVDKAKNELDAARGKLEVLRKYTQPKMLKQYDSDIATAQAKWQAEKDSHELEVKKRKDLEQQIEACTIVAPIAGQVVHGNLYSRRGGSEFVLEPGSMIRERQIVIRLPDPTKMQIKALVNESRVSQVAAGMPVAISLEALKDHVIQGKVTKVNQYAEPGSWSSGNIKEYATYIAIADPPPEMRSGMNAEVRISVERQESALQVPVQTLYETKGHYFCLVKQDQGFETRAIEVGSSNEHFMTIKQGLQEGEQLVMNPRAHASYLQLPELPDKSPQESLARESRPGAAGDRPPQNEQDTARGPGDRPQRPPADLSPQKLFARLDKDGDGTLSSKELGGLPAEDRERILAAHRDAGGAVSRAEFLAALQKPAGGEGPNGRKPPGGQGPGP
jgi:HlyD family secretion protein